MSGPLAAQSLTASLNQMDRNADRLAQRPQPAGKIQPLRCWGAAHHATAHLQKEKKKDTLHSSI